MRKIKATKRNPNVVRQTLAQSVEQTLRSQGADMTLQLLLDIAFKGHGDTSTSLLNFCAWVAEQEADGFKADKKIGIEVYFNGLTGEVTNISIVPPKMNASVIGRYQVLHFNFGDCIELKKQIHDLYKVSHQAEQSGVTETQFNEFVTKTLNKLIANRLNGTFQYFFDYECMTAQ